MFEICDISADISAIYWISVPINTIFAIENRSVEKSKKISKISSIYRPVTDISVDFSALSNTRTWGNFFGNFSSIYRRYIENIGDISVAACVAEIDPAEDPTVKILSSFQWLV